MEGKHKKQSGGHGQYGHVKIAIEPSTESDFEFVDKIFGGAVPKQYIPAVYLSLIYTELDDFNEAFYWLDKSIDEREFWAIWLPVEMRRTHGDGLCAVRLLKERNGEDDDEHARE